MERWIVALLALVLMAAPARAEQRWLKAESPQFIAYGEVGEEKLVAAVRDLEALDGLLRRMTQTAAPPSAVRLELYLFNDRAPLEALWPGASQSIAGFYTARPDLIAAFNDYSDDDESVAGSRARTRSAERGKTVLYHEYAHHFMHQYFSNAYPGWYTEGFADYIGNVRFVRGKIEVGRVDPIRASWLVAGEWMPIERFLKGRDKTFTAEDVAQFYAQAWLAVHYLVNTPERMAGFRRYVVALRDGGDAIGAFTPAFGIDPETFHGELRRYRRAQLNAFALTRPAEVERLPVSVTPLPPSAEELLLYAARMRFRPDANSLQALRTAAARFPGDVYAQRTIALGEIKAGDPAAAITSLDGLLAASPQDPEALYLKGLALIVQSRRDGADAAALLAQTRPLLGRANRLKPNDPHILYRYAEASMGRSDAAPESTLNVILLAQQLAPQVAEYRLNAANMLMHHERYDEAVALLRPLAYEPHGGEMATTAQGMLEAARARRPYKPGAAE
jgi:tetratricopeptide (TPR) repeat protein